MRLWRRVARNSRRFGSLCFVTLVAVSSGAASENGALPQTDSSPHREIERIGEGRFRIGNIVLDKTSQTLRLPAQVNMQKGIIELVACSSGGKLHESLFLAHVEPYHLHLALLLLGLNHKGGVRFQGDGTQPEGDRVVIFVERDGRRQRVERYIWDIPRKATMEPTGWVFTGSKFVDGQFGAQLTRTLITTYRDPYTILDNPLPTGADDTVYEVNSQVTPSVGTTVTLVIRPQKSCRAEGEKQ
ncbi:hypothetical protein AMJ85_02150 [candidate division BRC1 bacterium SM23_51]|nr:MAG: hypothetical protein AMJ85_02150 [candidate division BRC1 bacterium SM23_51]